MSPGFLPGFHRGLINLSCVLLLLILLLLSSLDWKPVHGYLSSAQRNDISNFIEEIIGCRNIAGLTLTVVYGDGSDPDDVFSKGFGFIDINSNELTTNETLFALGSLTATFTTTLVAKLLHAQKEKYPLGWDTPIKEVLVDDFRLYDNLRTDHATLRDLAAHKMGYPDYGTMNSGLDPSHSRSEYCRRYHLLKPTYEFRGEYHYSREMFSLLGCVAETLAGAATWEDLVRSYLLKPLGMTSTQFYDGVQNLATPYVRYNDSFLPLDLEVLKGIYPAEAVDAIVSNGQDMAKWLHYHIVNVANMSLVQEGEVLEETYRPQIQYNLKDMKYFAPKHLVDETVFAHNLGWDSGRYRGYRFIQQKGQLPGFSSKLVVFRDMDLGIFISMNSGSGRYKGLTGDIITWYLADLLLLHSERPMFLAPLHACMFENPFGHERSMLPNSDPPLSPARHSDQGRITQREDGWESKYVGQYGHQLFGNLTISYDFSRRNLKYECGRIATGILIGTDKIDQLQIQFQGPLHYLNKLDHTKQMLLHFKEISGDIYSKVRLSEHLEYKRDVLWDIASSAGYHYASVNFLLVCLTGYVVVQ